ncbi:MAG: PadR family transcriptional regulator [Acidobacteriaceae bacterium]|nr:PadR family transcriptional regulator [Acidobacteriaceae bacterium]
MPSTACCQKSAALANLQLELRRGTLVLAVLAAVRSEQYGYTLRKKLAGEGIGIDENTLYPLLRRLESQGLLVSQWREQDRRTKRFYRLSKEGEIVLQELVEHWEQMNGALRRVMQTPHRPDVNRGGGPPSEGEEHEYESKP